MLFTDTSSTNTTNLTTNADTSAGTGLDSLNASLNLQNLQSIQGHTIIDGLQGNEIQSIMQTAIQTTSQEAQSAISSAVDSVKNSSFLKIAIAGIAAFIAWKFFIKRR